MPLISRHAFTPHDYNLIREGVLPVTIAENVYSSWVQKFERNQSVETYRIEYLSDNMRVTGVQLRPTIVTEEASPAKLPLIIFNRGGRGRYGMLNVLTINNLLAPLVEKGYVLLASNYRGVDGGEGEDEFGGAEVQDILALQDVAKHIEQWDGKNIFLFGWSRGGMMTLLALKHGARVNAASLGAPLVDLTLSTGESQQQEAWLKRVLPNYADEGFKALERRSAPYWLHKLEEVPLLLMHGDADSDVSILHSRNLQQQLSPHNKNIELIEYPNGNHYLNRERSDVLARTDEWFRRFLK